MQGSKALNVPTFLFFLQVINTDVLKFYCRVEDDIDNSTDQRYLVLLSLCDNNTITIYFRLPADDDAPGDKQ